MNIIDLHCDTINRLLEVKEGSCLSKNGFHIDLGKLEQAGYVLQTFALFMDLRQREDVYENCMEQYRLFQEEMERNKDRISHITTYDQYLENRKLGKLSALLSIEEGAACKESVEQLREFYNLGVRMMTLTWNYANRLASPNDFPGCKEGCTVMAANKEEGLTEIGFLFMEEMAKLNMMLDVAHLGDKGIYDVLEHSKGPVIASHSNARSVCRHMRNLKDDMIAGIAKRGGIIGVNFYPYFLENKPKEQCKCTVEVVIKHMKHLQNKGGIDCVALGTDFDGMDGKLEIKNASQMPILVHGMRKHGFTETEVEKICYKNAERFLKENL